MLKSHGFPDDPAAEAEPIAEPLQPPAAPGPSTAGVHTRAGEQEAAAAAEQRLSLARLSGLMNEPASSSELRLLGSLLTP